MKLTELMIGDQVKYQGLYTEVVDIVSCGSTYPLTLANIKDPEDVRLLFGQNLKDVKPIAITPEILKANGFVEKEAGKGRLVWTDGETVDIEMWKTCGPKWSLEILSKDRMQGMTLLIPSVHELQHAVRLMGLYDFANNLVIEEGGQQ
jgi:hypothetical protein